MSIVLTLVFMDDTLGKRIAEERRRLRWTQQQLADQLDLGRSAVAMLETGRSQPDVPKLMELEREGFDVLFVLTGERSELAAARYLNWSLLQAISDAVRRWSETRGVALPTEKEWLVVRSLYERFAAEGVIDGKILDTTLQIAA